MNLLCVTDEKILNLILNDFNTDGYIHYKFNDSSFYEVANNSKSFIVFVAKKAEIRKQLDDIKTFIINSQRSLGKMLLFDTSCERFVLTKTNPILLPSYINNFRLDTPKNIETTDILKEKFKDLEFEVDTVRCISNKGFSLNSYVINHLLDYSKAGYDCVSGFLMEYINSCNSIKKGHDAYAVLVGTHIVNLKHSENERNWKVTKRKLVDSHFTIDLIQKIFEVIT